MYMCQTIYISSVGEEVQHERFCWGAGHPEHTEEYVNGKWVSKN